jgi:uncharacterized protein involved in response to NO
VTRPPLWSLGLRPFYLLASVFAAIAVPLWALQYADWLPFAAVRGVQGHAREMVFGFAFAVIAGFLFTAVRNWTAQPTPVGAPLALIAATWVVARVLGATPFAAAAAWASGAFAVLVAMAIAMPLVRSRNRRNYFFVAVVLALGAVAAPAPDLQVALDLVLFTVAVVGGRVIPMFTNNAIPGAGARRLPWVERLALGLTLAVLVADIFGARPGPLAALAVGAGIAHAARLASWRPWRTRGTPMIWVLHVAYAWIVVHFSLRALALLGAVPASLATHALTIGVIGGMTLGMMTRSALGHTGRAIAAERGEAACFALINAAGVVRVFGALAPGALYLPTVLAAAACWSAAFGLYALRYWPVLTGLTYVKPARAGGQIIVS